jgi:hypothetical protein
MGHTAGYAALSAQQVPCQLLKPRRRCSESIAAYASSPRMGLRQRPITLEESSLPSVTRQSDLATAADWRVCCMQPLPKPRP